MTLKTFGNPGKRANINIGVWKELLSTLMEDDEEFKTSLEEITIVGVEIETEFKAEPEDVNG